MQRPPSETLSSIVRVPELTRRLDIQLNKRVR
jgi:hypothetical protein